MFPKPLTVTLCNFEKSSVQFHALEKKGGLGDRISEQCAIWLLAFLILLMFRIAIHYCDRHVFLWRELLAGKMVLVGKMEERAT